MAEFDILKNFESFLQHWGVSIEFNLELLDSSITLENLFDSNDLPSLFFRFILDKKEPKVSDVNWAFLDKQWKQYIEDINNDWKQNFDDITNSDKESGC